LLYQYISTPSGLSEEWFADNVNSRGEFFYFGMIPKEKKRDLLQRKPEKSKI
jgi:hypothetical protein